MKHVVRALSSAALAALVATSTTHAFAQRAHTTSGRTMTIGPPPAPAVTARADADASLLDEATRWLTAATTGPAPGAGAGAHTAGLASATAERAAPETATGRSAPLLDLAPSLGLVARDWRGSMRLAGRSVVVDDVRPTASSRMVFARLSTAGRLPTFVQLGAGQWRIDTAMFPSARSYSELGGQLGAGFEIAVLPTLRIAAEGQYTFLFRDLHYSVEEVAPLMTAGLLAMKGTF